MKPQEPILIADLLYRVDEKLIDILSSLSPEDWQKQTIAPQWKVKDIAVHLLDGNIRALSMLRDGHFGESPGDISTYNQLLKYLNQLNADWVKAMKRVSPSVVIQLLKSTGKEYCDYINGLDPFATATFPVAWAGEEQSANWFHTAREYTEKWHHQQQIRKALEREDELYEEAFYLPYLETSMRALPHHYKSIKATEGDRVKFTITGLCSASWEIVYSANQWHLTNTEPAAAITEVQIPHDMAWRIFTKGIKKEEALARCTLKGNENMGTHVFSMLAVMA